MGLFENIIAAIKGRLKEGAEEPQLLDEKRYEIELPQLDSKYKLRVTPISMGKGFWNHLAVEILDAKTNQVLGGYHRNYGTLYKTFYPFAKDGKEYAVYSKQYTATRVMSLPDCVDLGGEENHAHGFCPTEYYVPQPADTVEEEGDAPDATLDGSFGFVSGCIWGDDSSWKIQYLDLSQIENGILKREERFGYIELARDDTLRDAIRVSEDRLSIKTEINFDRTRRIDFDFSMVTYTEYEKQRDAEDPDRAKECAHCEPGHLGKGHYRGKHRLPAPLNNRFCNYWAKDKKEGRCPCPGFEPKT